MKIAFVYDVIYPYVKGGVEKRIRELAVRLSSRGHDVHIVGMKYWEGPDTLKMDGDNPARNLSPATALCRGKEDNPGSDLVQCPSPPVPDTGIV